MKKIDANGVSVITSAQDLANARIQFENGAVVNLTASRLSVNPMRKFRLFQEHCYISLDLAAGSAEIFRLSDKNDDVNAKNDDVNVKNITTMLGEVDNLSNQQIIYEKPFVPTINAMELEQQTFINSILNDEITLCSLEEGTAALEIADEIERLING